MVDIENIAVRPGHRDAASGILTGVSFVGALTDAMRLA
jgi:hypothetical protein